MVQVRGLGHQHGGTAGNYSAGCSMYDYGADGLSPGASIVTFSTLTTTVAKRILRSPAVWAGLRAFQDGGIDAWDDFLVFTPASKPVFTLRWPTSPLPQGRRSRSTRCGRSRDNRLSWYTNGTLVTGANSHTYATPPWTPITQT